MIGPRSCAYACAFVDLVLTGQICDISISICIGTRRTNVFVLLVLFYIYSYIYIYIYNLQHL